MCGIAGIMHFDHRPIEWDALKRFTDSMSHRGPDAADYQLLENHTLGLGQRRLSILDLSDSGIQPMPYANQNYWITYNGEVFNFQSIKDELISLGYSFKSNTDTEVIIASYMHWGKDCLHKFNGMWAFAIWDNTKKELFLARDRFGIKPCYYLHQAGKRFAFASETLAFKYLQDFSREINQETLALNQLDPYAIEGLGYTIYKNIFQLLPAHYILIKPDSEIKQSRWWHIDDYVQNSSDDLITASTKFYDLFRDACRIRLVSDVPVATALSGGLDSTSVYSTVYSIIANEKVQRTAKDAQRAFTAVFPGLPHDEQAYAEQAASFTKGKLELIENSNTNLAGRIETDTYTADYLGNAPLTSISGIYAGMRKNGIVVSLDGHGVDEMLYGYRDMVQGLYQNALWTGSSDDTKNYATVLSNMYHSTDRIDMESKLQKQFSEKKQRESSLLYSLTSTFRKNPFRNDFLPVNLPSLSDKPYNFSNKPLPERMLYYEFFQHTLPALLRNFDRAGMINSVEIRMPFMDWRLVTYIFSLHVSFKIGEGFTKRILRDAMKGKMHEDLRTRTYKVGIGSPLELWFNGSLRDWAMDHVTDQNIKRIAESELKNNSTLTASTVRDLWQNINLELIR